MIKKKPLNIYKKVTEWLFDTEKLIKCFTPTYILASREKFIITQIYEKYEFFYDNKLTH